MTVLKSSKIVSLVYAGCLFVLVLAAAQVVRSMFSMEDFAQKRFESIMLAAEVRSVSTALTANARFYVSTGNESFERAYWELVNIRAGKQKRPAEAVVAPHERITMQELLIRTGFTQEELNILEQAVKLSAELVLLETEAMNAAKGLFKDSAGNYTVHKEPDLALAQSLMFSDAYDATVQKIIQPSFRFDSLVNARLAAQESSVTIFAYIAIGALCIAIVCIALVTGVTVRQARKGIIEPIADSAAYAQKVTAGNLDAPVPSYQFKEGHEIGSLINSMKAMVMNLKERIALAEQKTGEAERQAAAAQKALAAQDKAEAERRALIAAALNVEQVVIRLSIATEQLSGQLAEVTRGAGMQREYVSASVSAMDEVNSMVVEVAENAELAAKESDKTNSEARKGEGVMHDSVDSISMVQENMQDLQRNMQFLGQRAEAIGTIMTVISDIADQTNLLALNAAIEAARAGDAGRGFAVVADEVRKLAEKTMDATKEVGDAIRGIQTGTEQSIQTVQHTTSNLNTATEHVKHSGAALQEIAQGISRTAAQISRISAAAAQQSRESKNVMHSLDDINGMAEKAVLSMHEASQAVSNLASQSQELQSLVEDLRAL